MTEFKVLTFQIHYICVWKRSGRYQFMYIYLQTFLLLFLNCKCLLFIFAETAGKHTGLNESRPEDFIDVCNIHISPCADMLTSCRITIWCIKRAHMSPHVQ